ncbi:hypothetical protein ISN44_As01g013850 [Arabidopsis suecica]|uniref:Uncharacterized protein n=1 Tax=Arabidopsis suecica TaxID=45249 RepID=A0A8T2H252_ARASU|nr:hypothetical protein ISN44_As01g013850 [Arabidopsis suecica]
MKNLRITIVAFLAVLVFITTVTNSLDESKVDTISGFIENNCKLDQGCLNHIACKHCSYRNCKCDNGTCKCHGSKPPSP